MKKYFIQIKLTLLFFMIVQIGSSQSITIKADNYKQEFIGVGASVGNYFEKYFDNSETDQQQICRWLANDLHYKYLKSYDGKNHPDDRPDYYDERAEFFHDLRAYKSDIEMMICVNQISEMYQDRIDADEQGIYDIIANRYFDILEAYHDRDVPVTVLELLNEPGGESKVLSKGKVYAYAVPILRDIINTSSSNPNGVPMPEIAGPGTWGVEQCPYWINGFKNDLTAAWNNLDIVTTHGYNKGWIKSLYKDIYDIIEGKPFYNSEQTGKEHSGDDLYSQVENGTIDPFISAGLSLCQRYTAGMNGGINAFLAFQNYNTKDNNAALLQVTSGNSPNAKKMYWAFKQITSIQPANCNRVGKSTSGMGNTRVLVMRKQGENSVYLHLTNIDANSKNVAVSVNDYMITGYERWVTDENNNSATSTEVVNYNSRRADITVNIAGHAVTTLKLEVEPENAQSYDAFYITHRGSGLRLQSAGSDVALVNASNSGDDVKWILKDAETGYSYLENAADGNRLYSNDGSTVSVASESTTNDYVRWSRNSVDATYDFIINKSSGKKLHSNSSSGWDVLIGNSGWTGNNVQWSLTSAGTVMKNATLTKEAEFTQETDKTNVYCYPNPAIDMLNIGGVDEVTSIAIYNMYGKKLIENINSSFINVDSLPKGMYMVRINGNKTLTFIKK